MIPAELYNFYYNNVMLLILVINFIVYAQGREKPATINGYNAAGAWAITGAMVFFIGTRPISTAFVDMPGYQFGFNQAATTGDAGYNDWLFNEFTTLTAQFFSEGFYFLAIAVLYIMPMALAASRVHGGWALALILSLFGAFSFFTYGVNGVRNGIATSFLLLAIAYSDRKVIMAMLMLMAVGFHKSALLPAAAFIATLLVSRVGFAFLIWVMCLLANLVVGERLAPLMASIVDFGEDGRFVNYATSMGDDKGGFRLDFILYSIVPVLISYFVAEKSVRAERFFRRLVSAYLITNACWLLVMYASQSNRFAYLSWFLLPWIIVYPHIPVSRLSQTGPMQRPRVWRPEMLGLALVAHHAFTYVMAVFVYRGRSL